MGTLHTFRPRATAPHAPPPPSPAETRRLIEEAAQAALDTADRLLGILDRMDGDPEAEDGGDAEPSLGAPENHHGSQIVWLRGNDGDREAEVSEVMLPELAQAQAEVASWPFPWSGSGNVLTAAGVALLGMVAGR